MVRVGGMAFSVDVDASLGRRISNMHLLRTGAAIEAGAEYVVAGWASVNEGTQGPPIWDIVADYLKGRTVAPMQAGRTVKFTRAGN